MALTLDLTNNEKIGRGMPLTNAYIKIDRIVLDGEVRTEEIEVPPLEVGKDKNGKWLTDKEGNILFNDAYIKTRKVKGTSYAIFHIYFDKAARDNYKIPPIKDEKVVFEYDKRSKENPYALAYKAIKATEVFKTATDV